jgi:hypothetical protein
MTEGKTNKPPKLKAMIEQRSDATYSGEFIIVKKEGKICQGLRQDPTLPPMSGVYLNCCTTINEIELISLEGKSHEYMGEQHLDSMRRSMLSKWCGEGPKSLELTVLGGGFLELDPGGRNIKTFGKSKVSGAPDRDLVERILRTTHPDYTLDVQVTDYIRE